MKNNEDKLSENIDSIYFDIVSEQTSSDDYIIRAVEGSTGDVDILAVRSTSEVFEEIRCFEDQFRLTSQVIIKTIKHLKRSLDFNGFYNSYLLNMLPKDEFEKISNDFMIKHTEEIDVNEVFCLSNILNKIPDVEFDEDDIADILEIEEAKIIPILRRLKYDE